MNDAQKVQAARIIAAGIVEACHVAEPIGAPGGHIYAALMSKGCTLAQYERIMDSLTAAAVIEKHGDCYRATDKGRKFAGIGA